MDIWIYGYIYIIQYNTVKFSKIYRNKILTYRYFDKSKYLYVNIHYSHNILIFKLLTYRYFHNSIYLYVNIHFTFIQCVLKYWCKLYFCPYILR